MSNDPIVGGDAAAAASVIAVMESGKTATDEEELIPKENEYEVEGATPPGAKGFIGQFQDARKGATLYSDFSFKDDPPHQNNNINLRAHLDEVDHHSFQNYDETLARGKSSSGRGRYCYSIVRSKGCRRFAVGMVVLGTIVGMSVGISKAQQRKKNLPDWEGMLAEEEQQQQQQQQQQSGIGSMGGTTTTTSFVPTNNDPATSEEISKSYMHSALKYHPIWFSREQGWNGQTYGAASAFCTAQDRESVLCPYEAICPAGANTMPLGGERAGAGPDGSTWVPFGDDDNAWTQVGIAENWCEVLEGAPQWGESGEGVTRHVACCRMSSDEDVEPSIGTTTSITASDQVEQEISNQMSVEKYSGQWFDRTSGWGGDTLFQAMSFCGSNGNMVVCPYDAYCPQGENSVPFGGVKVGFNGEQDQWAPVGDKFNEWVSIGSTNMCVTLSDLQEKLPAFDFTKEGSQKISQHILCCPVDKASPPTPAATIIDEAQQAPAPAPATPQQAPAPATPQQAPASTAVVSAEAKQAQFAWALEAYQPEWFDRSNGWVGTNYGEAINFCQQKGGRTICPFEAYCPMTKSPGSTPFGGVKSEYSWAPIDDAENWWVQVSGSDTCQLYNEMNGGPPSWGRAGKNELETGYVACCKQPDDGMGDADYYHSSMSDETETLEEVVIDKAECKDHPTAVITTDGKTCENFIAHVGRVRLHNARCSHETPLKDENGETLLIKDVCRLSCGTCGDDWHVDGSAPATPQPQPPQTVEVVEENGAVAGAEANFKISRYDRSTGWTGSSYNDALKFCGKKGSTLCPYEAYCPQGPGKSIVGGTKSGSQWVPFINVANGWIQSGPEDTCMPYNSLNSFPPEWGLTGGNKLETLNIMCCEADDNWVPADQIANVAVSSAPSVLDKAAMDHFKPIWYGRKHGWKGSTHQDAEKFCNNIGDLQICPILALCPDGQSLFNNKSPYPGEQWAPLDDGSWAFIGSDPSTPHCSLDRPAADVDRMPEDKKQHIMCCAKSVGNVDQDLDYIIQASMEPTWYGKSDGWNGGSHRDAMDYCQKNQGGKELCPYVGYCPNGEGHQPLPGHPVDFNTETVQWSPWVESQGTKKGWVMVSQKYQNSATTCMTYSDLEGGVPPWDEVGSSSMFAESKKYVLCCSTGIAPSEIPQSTPLLPAPANPTPANPTPTPKPISPPTPKPTFPPQEVKWYPMLTGDKEVCVQGGQYDPWLITQGWTYDSEASCCAAFKLDCAVLKIAKWYPTFQNGLRLCMEGKDYPSSYQSNGWLFNTATECCEGMGLDCASSSQKWHPTEVNGVKSCIFDIPPDYLLEEAKFDSEVECCAAYPIACPTTTTTTTATIPAVVTPPCQPSGGKGCHWFPKIGASQDIKCVYSSDWPIEAADHLYSDHETCYCTFNDC